MKFPLVVTTPSTRYRVDLAYPLAAVCALTALAVFFADAHWFVCASAAYAWVHLAWVASDGATQPRIEKTSLST